MRLSISLRILLISFQLILFYPVTAQNNTKDTGIVSSAIKFLRPEFKYQYNVYSNFFKQDIKLRTSHPLGKINPADTLELKKKLKNDTSDATTCMLLYDLYKKMNDEKSTRFYLYKALYWNTEKLKANPYDSTSALNLAILRLTDNDIEGAREAYKILARNVNEKETAYLMLGMLYVSEVDSMKYYMKEFDQKTEDDYKKMILWLSVTCMQKIYDYNPKDSLLYKSKNYTELTDWAKIEALYSKSKSNFKSQLAYNAAKTFLIVMQAAMVNSNLFYKDEKEIKRQEAYYLDIIKDRRYLNKLVPYFSLSAIYVYQGKYEKALEMHLLALTIVRKYQIADYKEEEEILNSCVGIFAVSERYNEGADFTQNLIGVDPYNLFYKKAYIYFLYESGYSPDIEVQTLEIKKNNPKDPYPYLIQAIEALKRKNYDTMYNALSTAYSMDPSRPEVFGLMAVLSIQKGEFNEAKKYLSYIEEAMPMTVAGVRKYIK
jgi:tetratricopeptide (TPR) repeat protein